MSVLSTHLRNEPPVAISTLETSTGRMEINKQTLQDKFNREPFGFSHNLHSLSLFRADSIMELAGRYEKAPADYYVSAGALSAGTVFFSVPSRQFSPQEALSQLQIHPSRILLKRPENHDPRFRELLDTLYAEVVQMHAGLRSERVVRLESAVFVTSAAAITPFHFDPEIGFFSQIEGEKIYHVYSPSSVKDPVLERFYLDEQISIGQLEIAGMDPAQEHTFVLSPGGGLHQPQDSPHWVETRRSRSVSYTFVLETEAGRRRGRALACNYYLRMLGGQPIVPGSRPMRDALKAQVMASAIPIRKQLRAMVRRLRRR